MTTFMVLNRTHKPRAIMLSFNGQQAIKDTYLNRLKAHHQADHQTDEIIRGRYWQGGKGCGVGCTLHSDDHAGYVTELGIPEVLTHVEDWLFEGSSEQDAREFAVNFLEAIPVGADLSGIVWKFLYWMFVDPTDGISNQATQQEEKEITQAVAGFLLKASTQPIDKETLWQLQPQIRRVLGLGKWQRSELSDMVWAAWAAMIESRAGHQGAQVWVMMRNWADSRADSKPVCYKRLADKLCELLSQAC